MKKIDLHIHTVPTVSDSYFDFSIEALKEYIEKAQLDAVAITNHNLFDRNQFEEISKNLNIVVFPGIEIDIESGHLLVISDPSDIDDFEKRCSLIFSMNGSSANSCISEASFLSVFDNPGKYLLVPHYDKNPKLELSRISTIREHIYCGEVASPKKFISMKKSSDKIVPVLFSDLRMKKPLEGDLERQTYIDADDLSVKSLIYSLGDKSKVSLDQKNAHRLIDVLDSGLKISTGITVVLGERSSGKTYTLDRISEQFENPKYIRQFQLVSSDDDKEYETFLKAERSSVAEKFLQSFKEVVDEVKDIDLMQDDSDIEKYLECLKLAASEAEKQDVYAKCKLFNENKFQIDYLNQLTTLIEAVESLLSNVEYKSIIDSYINRNSLLSLIIELYNTYILKKEDILKKQYINGIIQSIQDELQVFSSNTKIPDIDLYTKALNKEKVKSFEKVAGLIKSERIIDEKPLHSYKIIAKAEAYDSALSMKKEYNGHISLSDVFRKYNKPYDMLQELKKLDVLPSTEYYKFFVKISYEVFNKHGSKASGGERSEFNLLQSLREAAKSDILLLDEPESSFDNIFLNCGVNHLLKDLSKQMPVVVSTHNNTIGASIYPDYIIYAKKTILDNGEEDFHLYSGFASNKLLTDQFGNTIEKKVVLLDSLEAGETAYHERSKQYEILTD